MSLSGRYSNPFLIGVSVYQTAASVTTAVVMVVGGAWPSVLFLSTLFLPQSMAKWWWSLSLRWTGGGRVEVSCRPRGRGGVSCLAHASSQGVCVRACMRMCVHYSCVCLPFCTKIGTCSYKYLLFSCLLEVNLSFIRIHNYVCISVCPL